MQQYFNELAGFMGTLLTGQEVYTAAFQGEDSDFVRFNHARVRQATHVTQRHIAVDLILGQRHATGMVTLSGVPEEDRARLRDLVADLRARREILPEDPHLLYSTEVRSTESVAPSRLPSCHDAVGDILDAARGRDLVGIHASGGIHSGFASSLGQRNWHSAHVFNLDWSFYHAADKAVKSSHAGFEWSRPALERKVEEAAEQLRVLGQPPRTIQPGRHRVYLAPAALRDVVEMIAGDSFGIKAQRTKQAPLIRMYEAGARLNEAVGLVESTADGIAPNFQEAGFLRPDRVVLVEHGAPRDLLVSPRSAREYGVPTNGASGSESPQSLQLAGGSLPVSAVLRDLGTGVWISNIWYLNYSDRSACRTTGMTRFATFWVENGTIQAPLNVMRFDETAYRMLGENLVGLTDQCDWILDADSYYRRSTRSFRMPGALVDDFSFTL